MSNDLPDRIEQFRLAGILAADHPSEFDPAFAGPPRWEWVDAEGAEHAIEDAGVVPPGGKLTTRIWVVGCLMEREDDRIALVPLSVVLLSAALARQVTDRYAQLDGVHNAAVLSIATTHDPRDASQMETPVKLLQSSVDDVAAACLQ